MGLADQSNHFETTVWPVSVFCRRNPGDNRNVSPGGICTSHHLTHHSPSGPVLSHQLAFPSLHGKKPCETRHAYLTRGSFCLGSGVCLLLSDFMYAPVAAEHHTRVAAHIAALVLVLVDLSNPCEEERPQRACIEHALWGWRISKILYPMVLWLCVKGFMSNHSDRCGMDPECKRDFQMSGPALVEFLKEDFCSRRTHPASFETGGPVKPLL